MYSLGYQNAASALLAQGFSLPNDRAAAWARQHAGELVAGISAADREHMAHIVADAMADPDVTQEQLGDDIGQMFDDEADWRADMIARTETSLAAAGGQVAGFRDSGIQYVQITDGENFDPECVAADGAIWTLDDYEANPLQHPNCGRSATALDSADVNPDDVTSPQ